MSHATHLVQLWLDNDYGLYLEALEIAKHNEDMLDRDTALEEFIDSLRTDTDESSVMSDLLTWALSQVDWREISESYNELVEEGCY